ncbi:MAG: hypothetical protein IJW04_04095 [Ruminococcus sp.]|nr:hypothetical protein [Ruminococcus sp.]
MICSNKVSKPWKNKFVIPIIAIVLVCAVIAAVVISFNRHSDIYKMVDKAIKNTESKSQIYLGFETTTSISKGEKHYKTDTGGAIFALNNMEDALVAINAVSTAPDDTSSDYNVTATFYCDGENVYDVTSGKEVKADITAEEFREILDEYSLYMYEEKHATNAVFNENQMEEFKGSGEVTVTLDSPGDDILSEYAEVMSELMGESVKKSDLKVKAAFVSYVIYDEVVNSQTYTFSVEYIADDGENVNYTVSSVVSFSDDFDEIEEYDKYHSFLIKEE